MTLDLPTVREMLDSHGLFAKKSMGQNFLLNSSIVARIARTVGPMETVVEIGPGPGGLTRALLEAGAVQVVVVEKDQRFLPLLTEIATASAERLRIIEGDALKVRVQDLVEGDLKVAANLPYNIATPLLIGWLSDMTRILSMTLMFQKEVALRIVAKPRTKDYGRLTILSQWRCECKRVFDLPPSAFLPSPKVTSSVVHFIPRDLTAEKLSIQPALEKITQHAFGQRRKMLRASLKPLMDVDTIISLGINPEARAEELSIDDFVRLAKALVNK